MGRKIFWVRVNRAGSWEDKRKFVLAAIEAGANAVVVPPPDAERVREAGFVEVVSEDPAPGVGVVMKKLGSTQELGGLPSLVGRLRGEGRKTAIVVEVVDKETERAAVRAGEIADFVVVAGKDWKIIPLENIIAELHQRGGKLLAVVESAEEARVVLETLEVGTDGVLLDPEGVDEIRKTGEIVSKISIGKIELVPAKVLKVKAAGIGDRACVDTCSILKEGEGMLVGSQAEGMFLVHSETLNTEFVESRPFRVNAGAVHAYILLPDEKTKYLSELSAGDEVLVVDADGNTRSEVVGRVKIERRPLVLVEAEARGRVIKTLLQNAETINLVGGDGRPVSVTKLREGDEVLVHLGQKGRHFGVAVEETVIEK